MAKPLSYLKKTIDEYWVRCMVFNPTFNNIYVSYIVAVIFIGGGNRSTLRKKITDLLQVTDIEYTSPWAGFTLTLVVMHTDCTGRCKPVYYTIMTMTALWALWQEKLNRYTCTKLTSETTCLGIVSGNVRTWGWITWQQPTCRIKLVDRNRWP